MSLASKASRLAIRAVARPVFMAVFKSITVAFNSAIVQGRPAATLAAHLDASAMVLGVVFAMVSRTQEFGLHKGGVLGC